MKAIESFGFVTVGDYKQFVNFNIFKGKYYRVKKIALLLVIAALCFTLILVGYLNSNKNFWIIAGVIALCSFMFVYTVNVNVKRVCNRMAKTVRAKQRVTFGKNGFVFELLFDNEKDGENEYDEIFYDELDYVYDAPNSIYLYIEKRSVIIIPKRNMNISSDEARAFLKKYIPAQKLIICV